MQIVQAPRASAIFYNLLKGLPNRHPWLLPANICPIVPITLFKAGTPFEFVDISAETLHMDLKQLEERLEQGVFGGVLYAHTFGEPSTPNEFFSQIKSHAHNLILVDDRCLCVPDLDPDLDMIADLTLYSTGYAKIVDLGFGGYAFLKDSVAYPSEHLRFVPEDIDKVEKDYRQTLRRRSPYRYQDSDWLQTDADLPTWHDYRLKIETGLQTSIRHRAALNSIYASCLPVEIQLPQKFQTWRFNIRLADRQPVLDAIFSSGLFASSHYASLAGLMAPGKAIQADILANEIINLFNDSHFDAQQARQVSKLISQMLA